MAAVAGILIPDVSPPIPATDASFDDEAAMQVMLHDRKFKHKSQQILAIILHMGVEHARQILMLKTPLQVLNHLGALNLPDWWNAGKAAQDNSPIPFSEFHIIVQLLHVYS